MSCNKLYYFVYLDSQRHPIPDTMFAKSNAANNPCTTLIAQVTGDPMDAPAGYVHCFPENGLRYWYQVQVVQLANGQSRKEIVPESMIAVQGVPKGQAGRSCQYVEYKIFKEVAAQGGQQ